MPLSYTARKRLHAHRAKPKFKVGLFQNILIWIRAVIELIGVAFDRFNPDLLPDNYDEYSDRSDQPQKWYKKHYGK